MKSEIVIQRVGSQQNRQNQRLLSLMTEDMGNAELILLIESRQSDKAAHIFKQALEANDYNALWALGGLSEAYAKREQAISAGYSRRQS